MTEHEDLSGVFVPFWMLREAPSPAAAVALAQITWWFQPSLRGQDRERFIERKGERWLAMTDQRLGDALGLSEDAAHRIKLVLKREGYITTAVAKVDGVRCSLIRPVLEVLQRRALTADMRDSRPAESRDSSSRDIAAPIPLIETGIEKKETTSNDPVRRAARRLTDEWWEHRQQIGQAPVQPYIGVLKIVDRALRNGVTVNDLRGALAACATVTAASLEFTLSKQRGKVGRPPPNITPDVAAQIVADYEQANGKGPRNPAGRALPLQP